VLSPLGFVSFYLSSSLDQTSTSMEAPPTTPPYPSHSSFRWSFIGHWLFSLFDKVSKKKKFYYLFFSWWWQRNHSSFCRPRPDFIFRFCFNEGPDPLRCFTNQGQNVITKWTQHFQCSPANRESSGDGALDSYKEVVRITSIADQDVNPSNL